MKWHSQVGLLALGGALGLVACTSVLGEFETGEGGAGGATAACGSPAECPLVGLDATCAEPTCTDGTCGAKPFPKGSECSADGKRCDGAGRCVTCLDDGDCAKGKCVAGTCEVGELGALCGTGKDCGSGFCAQGVCCESDCTGACETCNLAGKEGTCEVAPLGTVGEPACAPFLCNGASGACPKSCAKDEECATGRYCEPTVKTCELQKSNGDTCSKDAMCASGDCYQSNCCKPGCVCGTCATGTCTLTAAPATDPNADCGAGTCDGLVGCSTKGAGVFVFAPEVGPEASVRPLAVAVDAKGGTVVVGEYEGTVTLGGVKLSALSGTDGFALKLSEKGDVDWAVGFGDSLTKANQSVRAVHVGSNGVITIAGAFSGGVKVGAASYAASSKQDTFVATLDSAGSVVASAAFKASDPQTGFVTPVGVTVDGLGAIVLAGNFGSKLSLGASMLTSSGGADGFVVRTKPDFAPLQSLRLGGIGDEFVEGIAMTAKGSLGVVGSFKSGSGGGFKVAGKELASAGDFDVFVANLGVTVNGFVEVFGGAYGSTGVDRARGVARGPDSEIYVTGSKTGGVNFAGGVSIPPSGAQNGDPFVVALSDKGTFLWAQSYVTTTVDTGRAIAVDAAGFVLFGGDFASTLTLKTGISVTPTGGTYDPFLAKLHPGPGASLAGAPVWGLSGQGSGSLDELVALDTTVERDVVAVGTYRGEFTIGKNKLPPATEKFPSMYVVRLEQ